MKGVLGKLVLGLAKGGEAAQVLNQIIEEIVAAQRTADDQWSGVRSLKGSPRYLALMKEPAEAQINVALAALKANNRGAGGSGEWEYWLRHDLPFTVARILLQKKSLAFTDDQLAKLVTLAARAEHLDYQFPVSTVLGCCERHLAGTRPTGALQATIEGFVRRVEREQYPTKAVQRMAIRAGAMLDPGESGPGRNLPKGAFADQLGKWIAGDAARGALADHLAEALEKSKPSKKWLGEGTKRIGAVGATAVRAQLRAWLEIQKPDPANPDISHELLKALIWLAPPDLASELGRFCQLCYQKVPELGARSIKLGNACLTTLEAMGDDATAVAELARLSRVIKYPSVRAQIAKRLARVADAAGVSVEALEDRSLPDFGLGPDGTARIEVGAYSAILKMTAVETSLVWENAAGKVLRSVPKPVRDDHAELVKQLRTRVKDIEGARASTVARLEQGWIDGLDWALEDWRDMFDGHPVRRQVARALIWQVGPVVCMAEGDGWTGPDGSAADVPSQGRIRLWHPLDSDPDEVLAWRRRILARGLTQPIKQAHREVYVLTEAELRTEVYSNRFAAHILRQHQFKALCEARGWQYHLMGAHFDSHNTPRRELPSRALAAAFTVDLVEAGGQSETGIALHVATDQVSFVDESHTRVPLQDVPAVVFSELMRDVDLFVAVTSVANDPGWTDGGPEGRFGRYWQDHAFGDLSQTAETRKQLLTDLLPSLSIGPKCRVEGNFLIVQGKLHAYAIHLGSANIQIRPSNRYLCIVSGGAPRDPVRLPFAGDGTLSIILSKAYMLVEDHKITDQTILMQLNR